MEINLKSDDALATPGTSKISRCSREELKARLKEQKESALALRQQAAINKKRKNLEYRKSQRKKVNKKKYIENDLLNAQHCISENSMESTFTSSEKKQQISNSITETPKLTKVASRLSGTPQRKQKKVKQAHNLEQKRAYEREKKRKQREKMRKDPEAYNKYCKLEKERNDKRKAEGKLKSIDQMNPREQRRMRKMWKANKIRQKKRKQEQEDMNNYVLENTPPVSPDSPPALPAICSSVSNSTRKAAGRKQIRKDRSKTYKELQKTKEQLKSQARQTEKWKKKYQRERKLRSKTPTPIKEVKGIIKKGTSEVKKQLLFGATLALQLKSNANNLHSMRDKQLFAKCISGKLLKKYRCIRKTKPIMSNYMCRKYTESCSLRYYRKKKNAEIQKQQQMAVLTFLEEDINSCFAPGKKDTKTQKKTKKQIRYLRDTLSNLHKKFVESTGIKLSYASFCNYKPFWFVKPKVSGRDTCLCIKHANMQFVVDSLCRSKVINFTQTSNLAKYLCCDANNKDCMYRTCSRCKVKNIKRNLNITDEQDNTTYYKWIKKKEERLDRKKNPIKVNFVVKEKMQCSVEDLITHANTEIPQFLVHSFNIGHQFSTLKKLKTSLQDNEVFIVIDFSENYECKYSAEIQSAHFGASKTQVTIHTGVMYYSDVEADVDKENPAHIKCMQFATISEDLRHDANAVWAHLMPILNMIKKTWPRFDSFHFQSDGPTTQYKNKTNLYLLSYFSKKLEFKEATWNFTEPGHGKSSADGVGGQLKVKADQLVAHGTDISDAQTLYKVLANSELKVKLFEVFSKDIEAIDVQVTQNLKPIPNTMKLRQVVWSSTSPNHLGLRTLSCFACEGIQCKHYPSNPSKWDFTSIPTFHRKKVSSQKDDEPRSNELNTSINNETRKPDQVIQGEWVAVCYDNSWYPGIVEKIEGNVITVLYMHRSGDKFFWPLAEDRHSLPVTEIMCRIEDPPQPISTRYFCINNVKDYDKLFQQLF